MDRSLVVVGQRRTAAHRAPPLQFLRRRARGSPLGTPLRRRLPDRAGAAAPDARLAGLDAPLDAAAGAAMSRDYTRCPQCGHKTVLFRFGRNGEDYLGCTYRRWQAGRACDWSVFRWADRYDTAQDVAQRRAWA